MKKNKIKFAIIAVVAIFLADACYNPFLQLSGEREIESDSNHMDSIVLIPMGEGSSEDPFLVHNKIELSFVGQGEANPDGYKTWLLTKYYKQVENIDMAGVKNFKPIGVTSKPFKGRYDGNGYAISNLRLGEFDSVLVGLFGSVTGDGLMPGIVENLAMVNVDIRGEKQIGAIVGYLSGISGGGKVRNCYVTGKFNCGTANDTGLRTIGGIAGVNDGGIVENCYVAYKEFNGSKNNGSVGGIVGNNGCVYPGTVRNCVAFGKGMVSESSSGRISNGYGTLNNNYAWAGTHLLPGAFPLAEGLNSKDGKPLSAAGIMDEALWTEAVNWDFDPDPESDSDDWIWEWRNGFMPKLKNSEAQPWPDYMKMGSGTDEDPYLIHNIAELGYVGRSWDPESSPNPEGYKEWTTEKCYLQAANLDMAGIPFEPIGDMLISGLLFNGYYNGGGHVISNLSIGDYDTGFSGLFGVLWSWDLGSDDALYPENRGMVENIGLVNVDVKGNVCGAIAGCSVDGIIRNCYATGKIKDGIITDISSLCLGGIVGQNIEGIVENCYTALDEINNSTYYPFFTGGIVGDNGSTVRNCVAVNMSMINGVNGGRISGNGGSLVNNYSWKYTEINGSPAPMLGSHDDNDGQPLSASDIKTKTQWTSAVNWNTTGDAKAWDFVNTWVWKEGYMPSLKNSPALPWPDYL